MTTTRERRHLPGLDGLRGTAILSVLVCHYSALLPTTNNWVGILQNGWAGVDLFFVISGFLITGILVDANGSPHYLRNFYARRALRIFPLYYGFLAMTLLVLLICGSTSWGNAGRLDGLWNAQPSLWTYTANFWIGRQRAWTTWSEIVIPLWSLSVEEQFYLAWPLVVLFASPRNLVGVCVGVMAGALALRLTLTACGTDWFAVYTWTPTRADSLAAGALLALLLRRANGEQFVRQTAKLSGPVAVLLVLILSSGFDPTRHPWLRDCLYAALAILFATIVFWSIDAASLRGIPQRFYELRSLRTVGRYSYGIYVVHLPLMYVTRAALERWCGYDSARVSWTPALTLVALDVILTFGIAWLSFRFFERRFLRLKRYFL